MLRHTVMKVKNKVILFVIAIIAFLPIEGFASLEWESIGPSGGDQFLLRISPENPDILYSVSISGLYRSTDAGTNWGTIHKTEMANGQFRDLVFGPNSANHLFVSGTINGVWYSPDQGATWENLNNGLPVYKANGNVVRSFPVISLAVDTNGRLFAGMSGINHEIRPPAWIYRSSDGGNNWIPDDSGIEIVVTELYQGAKALLNIDADGQLLAMVHGAGVFRYSNGSWISINGNLPTGALRCTYLEDNPQDSNHLLLGTEDAWVYETKDGGQSWSLTPMPESLKDLEVLPLVYTIAIDPNNNQLFWVDTNDSSGSLEQPLFKPQPQQTTGAGSFISLNGGVEWTESAMNAFRITPDPRETIVGNIPPYGPVQRSRIWYFTSGGFHSIRKSVDGALTFEKITNGLNSILINNIWLHPSPLVPHDVELFAAAESGLHLFTGILENWARQKAAQNAFYSWSFAADPQDSNTIYYSTGNPAWSFTSQRGIYRTNLDCFGNGCPPGPQILQDIGVWKVITTPLQPLTIYAACQEEGVMVSSDKGQNWSTLNNGLSLPQSITDIELDQNGLPLYAAARTSNGNVNLDPPQFWQPSIGEGGKIFRFDAQAEEWTELPGADFAVLDLEIGPQDPGTLFAASVKGIFKTSDNGLTWEEVLPNVIANDLLFGPQDPDYLYAATNKGVFRSTDGGNQWHDFSTGLTKKKTYSLAIDPVTGILYTGTAGNSVFRLLPDSNPVASLAIDPVSHDFGDVPLGFNSDKEITIINEGEADLIIEDIVPDNSAFSLVGLNLPITITPQNRVPLTVRFSPWLIGTVSGNITFQSNDAISPLYKYPVNGEGREPIPPIPDVKVNSSDGPLIIPHDGPITFDAFLNAGDYTGQESDFWIRLSIPDSITYWLVEGVGWVESVNPQLYSSGPLSTLTEPLSTTIQDMPAGDSEIYFAVDDNVDGIHDGTWADTAIFTVEQAPPVLAVSSETLNFGDVPVGFDKSMELVMGNNGEADLLISSIGIDLNDFELVNPPLIPLSINSGEFTTIQVRFTPQQQGIRNGVLTINSNDPINPVFTISLNGEGRETVQPVPDVKVNGSDGPLTIPHDGPIIFDAYLNAGDYTGQESDFWVRLSIPDSITYWLVEGVGWVESVNPQLYSSGPLSTLTEPLSTTIQDMPAGHSEIYFAVDGNADGNLDGTWSDTAVFTVEQEPPVLAVSPEVLEFGDVPVGFDNILNLFIGNNGEADLIISSIGENLNDFEPFGLPSFPITILSGEHTTIQVRFAPLQTGIQNGTLTINSNDPVNPIFSVPLSGTGTATVFPVVVVKANGQTGQVAVTSGTIVNITVEVLAGDFVGQMAEEWAEANTPFGAYWFSSGRVWLPSETPLLGLEAPIADTVGPISILNKKLPGGEYVFKVIIDNIINAALDEVWVDTVTVNVE